MPVLERKPLRDQVRREIRDETSTAYVFTDDELNTYLNNAIRAYSKEIPREVKADLALVAGQADYTAPDDLLDIVEISVGATEYAVTEIFGGLMTLSPTPSANATAVCKYRTGHTLPTADTGAGSTSTYDPIDEPLIVMHVKAQCWETLAGDGARYYDYSEGDIRENQGKTQDQYRKEANALYAEFDSGVIASKQAREARQPVAARTVAGVISRKQPTASTTIYKS